MQNQFLFIILASEAFQAASVFVLDTTVSKQTIFGLQIFLYTQRVVNQDYLIILLPSGVSFKTGTTPTCSFTSLTVSSCTLINSTCARINFTTSSQLSSIEGQISNFINPDSVRTVNNIEIDLYSGTTNSIKASTQSASLSNFQAATLTGSVSSSSTVVGATDVLLRVSLTPSTILKASGRIIVTIPQYYTNAGSIYMIGGSSPTCTGTMTSQTVSISSCFFSGSSLQLTVIYSLSGGADTTASMQLSISAFKNPITTASKQGFQVQTLDSNGFQIEQSQSLTLSGIITPANFNSYSLTLLDSSIVQTYTAIQFKLSLSLPIEQGCFLKFIFPSDFTIDDKFSSVQGSGFFRPSATTSTVTWTSQDSSSRTVVIPACQYLFGPDQAGIAQVKATSQFQIIMAKDSTFSINIAQISTSTNFVASASLFTYGSINSIQVSAVDSNYIQTDTNYSISFTPDHSLPSTGAVIVITFPSLITLPSSGCSITGKNAQFDSSSISCAISGQNVTISNPFTAGYDGLNKLQLQISKGTNPQSERSAGAFTISTYIRINNVNYIVDQGTSADNMIVPVGGQITKGSDIIVVAPQTYLDDQTYQFYLQFSHKVPLNGYLNFTIPSEVSISSNSLVSNNCKRLDTNKKMDCQVIGSNQILITIGSKAFNSDGIVSTSIFSFSVSGIKNPRTTMSTSIFYFSSYDQDFKRIDSSTSNDFFIATMTDVSQITSISIDNSNKTNYATTNYTFTVTPNTPIFQNDYIKMTFPPEIGLPDVSNLQCLVDPNQQTLQGVQCSKLGTSDIQINFIKVGSTISAGQAISFIISNVQNQISTKPSSPFSNILMGTLSGYQISKYSKTDLTVSTTTSSNINTRKLTQSNKNPNEQATYTITFTTYNWLPNTTAILITAPSIITLVQNTTACYVALTSIITNVCTINQTLIRVENAFATQTSNYFGEVSIIFQAINPGDNSNLQSIILRVYTDNSYLYRINKIESGLVPTLECNYPCRRCDQNNPDYCTDCFTEGTFPQFIQSSNSGQTCAYDCNTGYTSNGSKGPKVCTKCDAKCSQCYQNNQVGDINKCQQCAQDYPFYYAPNITCQKLCYENQYQCKSKECCDCQSPCKTCAGPVTCRSCYQDSDKPLLWIDKCVSTCPSGFTQVGTECIFCTSPCATCEKGIPTSCLTCNANQGSQLLFGRTCVSQCPSGTTPQYSNVTQSKCIGCVTGCLSCDQSNNAICLKCASGLALFRDQCWTECPFNYVKSKDGTACELRTYLLDDSLIYFPFGIIAVALLIITLAAFFISKQKSLILSNSIALLGLVEWAAVVYQTYYAYTYRINYTIITLTSLGLLCGLFLLNLAFVIFYCSRIQFSDIAFNYWRQKYSCSVIFILILSLLFNFKVFRMVYSRFFGLEFLSANIDDKAVFAKKIQVFSIISIFTFSLPLVVIDTLVVIYLSWGSQLYITCIESGLIAAVGAIMIAIDNCCMCSRLSYFEEKQLQKQKRKTKEMYSKLDQSKDVLVMGGAIDDEESKLGSYVDRENALKTIISQVKNNRELLANNHIDTLLVTHHSGDLNEEEELELKFHKKFLRKVASMQNLQVKHQPSHVQGEDERKTQSCGALSPIPKKNTESQPKQFVSIVTQEKKKMLKSQLIMEGLKQEYKYDNVYADKVDPQEKLKQTISDLQQLIIDQKPAMNECEIQTEDNVIIKPKRKSSKSPSSQAADRMSQSSKRIIDDLPGENSIDSHDNDDSTWRRLRRNKKNKQRGKSKNPYYTQINEEDQEDEDQLSLGAADEDTQREFLKTAYEQEEEDTIEFDQQRNKVESRQRQSRGKLSQGEPRSNKSRQQQKIMSDKSNKSRSSGMMKSFSNHTNQNKQDQTSLNFSDTQNINNNILSNKGFHLDQKQLELLQNQYEQEYFNQRTFNINSIIGDFVRTWRGSILNKRDQLESTNYHDLRGRPVNRRGYLIDETCGFILNRDNLNLMFRREQVIVEDDDQIPMPYKFERWNFNPHEIMGNFDYDKSGGAQMKPIILKNKQGQLVDKHLRSVNQSGFLIDEHENIIDNQGRVKFIREQLNEVGDLPQLFNYKGKKYDIRSIIGIFNRDATSKQIILNSDPYDSSVLVDKIGRRVNNTGYLVDKMANIVNQNGKIVFFKSQLMFNEPPKLFPFMKFDLAQIMGNIKFNNLNQPIFSQDQIEEDENGALIMFDFDGRRVNHSGYLIDDEGNIIDRYSNLVLRKELLELDDNKKSTQVPLVFRMGVFYDKAQYQANLIDNQNVFENNLLSQDLNQRSSNDLQAKLEQIQSANNLQRISQDDPYFNIEPAQNSSIVDIQINNGSQASMSRLSNHPFSNKDEEEKIDQQNNYQQQEEEGVLSDPEPLMNKVKDIPLPQDGGRTKKKRKQSAQRHGLQHHKKQQIREGEKVLNAYSISRPVSSYLPSSYQQQQRAKSQAKQRLNNNATNSIINQGDYNSSSGLMMNANTRLQSFNVTSQIQSNSDIFKKNAISALGFTEDFSKQAAPRIMKNQYINSASDDPSYNQFLEGADVNSNLNDVTQNMNFNWHNNPKKQNHHQNNNRIQQNESQLDKLYAEEVSRYIDQSDDEDFDDDGQEQVQPFQVDGNQQERLFNLGPQFYQDKRSKVQKRSSSNQRSRLKMYEKHKGGKHLSDLRSDSQGSNDSQLSRRPPAILQRSRKQLKAMDQKLKGLEHIYLQGRPGDVSTKNASIKSPMNGGDNTQGARRLRQMQDKYYEYQRESSPPLAVEQQRSVSQMIGRRKASNYN